MTLADWLPASTFGVPEAVLVSHVQINWSFRGRSLQAALVWQDLQPNLHLNLQPNLPPTPPLNGN